MIEALLIREEGRKVKNGRHYVYQDSLGFWTIGYGQLVDVRKGGGLTEKQALLLLRDEIADKRAALFEALPWVSDLDAVRQAVLLSMAFQMGVDGVVGFKNTLANIRAGNYAAAARGMLKSKWARQTPARAARMARAIETGVIA